MNSMARWFSIALYNPTTPADIGRLDVFERQIVLGVELSLPRAGRQARHR